MSQRRTTTRHPESGHEREPGRHALAELQRLSRLAPEVLRADGIRSCLGPGIATRTAGLVADRGFRDAGTKGLDPEDYDASRWEERIRALPGSSSGPAVARFDVALTVCTMRYVSDLRIGRINPQHFKFGLSVEQKKYDLAQFLRDRIMTASDVRAVLDEMEPPFAGYRRTEQALARYIELARTDDGEKLPAVTKPIEPGQSYLGVPRLARFLRLVGDLPADATLPSDTQTYSGPLVDAVKHFQRRHGLDDDGRLGPSTVKQLNVPLQDRVLQLQLTLERWRWLPVEFSAPPIVVNIPDFRLRALDENNNVVMNMRVVVGKAMRTQTPVFTPRHELHCPAPLLERSSQHSPRRNCSRDPARSRLHCPQELRGHDA